MSLFRLLLEIPHILFWSFLAYAFFIRGPYKLYRVYKDRNRADFKQYLKLFCLFYVIAIILLLGMAYIAHDGFYPLCWLRDLIYR